MKNSAFEEPCHGLGPLAPGVSDALSYLFKVMVADPNPASMRDFGNRLDAELSLSPGRSRRRSVVAAAFAEYLGLPFRETGCVRLAAIMHDAGKCFEELGSGEHPTESQMLMSAEIARRALQPESVVQALIHRTERWDGLGNPGNLAGEDIPYAARILAIVDHHVLSGSAEVQHDVPRLASIREGAGTLFDPCLVDRFVEFASLEPNHG